MLASEAASDLAILNGTLHHIGVATPNALLDSKEWQLTFGLTAVSDIIYDPIQKVRVLFLSDGRKNGTLIELVEPASEDSPVGAFLKTKNRFYHVCYEVPNLAETLIRLAIDGVELIDAAPRKGAEGPVAFLHPRSCHGVLVELIEAPSGPSWDSLGYR